MRDEKRSIDLAAEEGSAERRMARHYWFRAGVLLIYSGYIHHLVLSGYLFHYVAPRMEVYVKLASIGLIMAAGAQVWMALGGNRSKRLSCECCEPDPAAGGFRSSTLLYALLLLPIVYGFLLPNGMTGSELAGVKGFSLSGPSGSSAPTVASGNASSDSAGNPGARKAAQGSGADVQDDFAADGYNEDFAKLAKRLYAKSTIVVPEEGYLEVLRSIDLYLDRFVGKRLTVSGFVYREKGMQPNEFAVTRLVMSCCAADASSYGVLVRMPNAADLLQDTWITVSGAIGKGSFAGTPIMTLNADSVKRAAAPANPYVYLYAGDYEELAQ